VAPAAAAVAADGPAEPEELGVLGAATDDAVAALPVEEVLWFERAAATEADSGGAETAAEAETAGAAERAGAAEAAGAAVGAVFAAAELGAPEGAAAALVPGLAAAPAGGVPRALPAAPPGLPAAFMICTSSADGPERLIVGIPPLPRRSKLVMTICIRATTTPSTCTTRMIAKLATRAPKSIPPRISRNVSSGTTVQGSSAEAGTGIAKAGAATGAATSAVEQSAETTR
jgi:hypothetical protein